MDFGLLGFDNLLCSGSPASNNGGFALENAAEINKQQKCYGFGFLKQERAINEGDLRDFKVAKTSSLQRSNGNEGHQQMLSFSSPNSQPVTLPYYQHTSNAFGRNTGYGSTGVINGGSMQGVRGPFTPSQWMELEHQALIYKYIIANVPIPSYLLNPIRKAFESAGFSALRSNALGWGAFPLGFSNTDPEPGRCRRTDGKKWRCSRDAVADQKYCERHMNRGRHRSRKPVEGQPGHSASGATTTNGKLTPIASSTTTSVVPAGGVSNSLGLTHQLNNLQPPSNNHPSGVPTVNRSVLQNENASVAYQHTTGLSMTSPKVSHKDDQNSAHKQQNAFQESSRQEFGLVCSDSLVNPLNRSSSLINCRNYGASDNLNDHDNKSQHALRQFMDDWPKNQPHRSAISWPYVDLQPDRTQLSISIPMVTSDFMSSTSSPTNEKLTASPPRLSRELEMGLGVGTIAVDRNQRQTNWVPISWEPSLGGPLGEVLHTSNSTGECKNAKPLNLIDSWDSSPRLASSPTGVLQRGAFVSLSNSSAASSPRTESSKVHDGSSHCNGLINPGLMNPSLPAL